MTTEKNTSPVREPYDAMGPVDAPNPPAARATLADVRPGGRVRLQQALPPEGYAGAWIRSAYGQPSSFTYWNMEVAYAAGWQAALSAQPSPGGQGELLEQVARFLDYSVGHDPWPNIRRVYGDAWWEPVRKMRDELRALAARQPTDFDDEELQFYREEALNLPNILIGAGVFSVDHEGDYKAAWANIMDAIERLAALQPVGATVKDSLTIAARQPVASNQPSGNSGELDVDGDRQPVGEPAGPVGLNECPITGLPFYDNMEHPEHGLIAMYGGPLDVYSIPRLDRTDDELRVERYDLDADGWIEGGEPMGYLYREQQPDTTHPAQAVDLGQFRDLIGFAALAAINLPETDPRRDFIRQANEFAKLIDSQAVGNG